VFWHKHDQLLTCAFDCWIQCSTPLRPWHYYYNQYKDCTAFQQELHNSVSCQGGGGNVYFMSSHCHNTCEGHSYINLVNLLLNTCQFETNLVFMTSNVNLKGSATLSCLEQEWSLKYRLWKISVQPVALLRCGWYFCWAYTNYSTLITIEVQKLVNYNRNVMEMQVLRPLVRSCWLGVYLQKRMRIWAFR
jgi:hypothetical protein